VPKKQEFWPGNPAHNLNTAKHLGVSVEPKNKRISLKKQQLSKQPKKMQVNNLNTFLKPFDTTHVRDSKIK